MSRHPPPRCFLAADAWVAGETQLAPEESRHLLRVLRARVGDPVIVFDGCGRRVTARLVAADRGGLARIRMDLAAVETQLLPPARIILAQALPKHNLMDTIVQKAVELGAAAVWPLLTERVVAAGDAERQESKAGRWHKIAREAARQCGTDWIPEVRPPMDLSGLVAELHTCHRCFVGALTPDAVAFRQAAAAARPLPAPGAALMIVIGPEGDFAPSEMELLTSAGGIPVSFGATVLRVETAALYALSLMHYEFLSATKNETTDNHG